MRRFVLTALTLAVSLVAASGASAVVVNDQGNSAGVALVPGGLASLAQTGVSTVTSGAPCSDPALTSDLGGPFLPTTAVCYHGGAVMHQNETFTLTWDPLRRYWQTTRDYVEQFLSDVAAGSGTLTSPYAVTTQYTDATGRAGNASLYGGGCIDYGNPGGYTCKFGDTTGTGTGDDYPANGCPVTGTNQFVEQPTGAWGTDPNDICLTDAQLQVELATMISRTGLLARTTSGYTPLVVLLTPPGVEACLDAGGALCSANAASTAMFCSYHSQVDVGGTRVAYVVQPWTASWDEPTGCDEPDAPKLPAQTPPPDPNTLAIAVGARLVSPLSQGQIATIVNPGLKGWYALDGSEINDNGCVPLAKGDDQAIVGSSAQNPYFLQREFNNAGAIGTDPNAPLCTPDVTLAPTFVVPSAVSRGDVVEFDGSTTDSTLLVPNANYVWNYGDGTTATGPSVEHSYAKSGAYTVTLTVTDRGGDIASVSRTIDVGRTGQAPPTALRVRLQLMPQGLHAMLRRGVDVLVSANELADGIASLSISRAAAKSAHIRAGRSSSVVVGRGTVSGITAGTVNLHLRLSPGIAAKLGHLRHVTVTVRLAVSAAGGAHLAIDAAGRY